MPHPTMPREQLRNMIMSCRKCGQDKDCQAVYPSPRYGAGSVAPDLMIVAQNPPQDKVRCLHGAYMLHYNGPDWDHLKTNHERYVLGMVAHLGLTSKQVYGTQAAKCATPGNAAPNMRMLRNCRPYLMVEIRDLKPKVILAFGQWARYQVHEAIGWSGFDHQSILVNALGVGTDGYVSYHDNIIYAPHPSVAGRFLNYNSWLSAIKTAYDYCSTQPRLVSHWEKQE